jgi:hypothetical protein
MPSEPLPSQSSYQNPSFYLFGPDHTTTELKLDIDEIDEKINKELDLMRGMTFLKNPKPRTWEPPTNLAAPSDHKFLNEDEPITEGSFWPASPPIAIVYPQALPDV